MSMSFIQVWFYVLYFMWIKYGKNIMLVSKILEMPKLGWNWEMEFIQKSLKMNLLKT